MHDFSFFARDFNDSIEPFCAKAIEPLVNLRSGITMTIAFPDQRLPIKELNVMKIADNQFAFSLLKKPQRVKEFGDDAIFEDEKISQGNGYDLGIDASFSNDNGGALEFYNSEGEPLEEETTLAECVYTIDEVSELLGNAYLQPIVTDKGEPNNQMVGPFNLLDAVEFIKVIEHINIARGLERQAFNILAPLVQKNKEGHGLG